MKHRFPQCVSVAILLGMVGCSHQPKWTHGVSASDLYYQGVGEGSSTGEAQRRADLDLCGAICGRSIQSIREDYEQAVSRLKGGHVESWDESTFRQWISEEIDCDLPSGSRIAERARIDTRYWAYAIAERPGQERRINQLFTRRTSGMKARALVPGWAQFRSGQPDKAWSILLTEGVGLVGLGVSAILSSDYRDRRDRARQVSDYEYYDDWANRFYWSSVSFGVVTAGTYLYSLIDGISSNPLPYRVLLSGPTASGTGGSLRLQVCYALP